MRESQTAFADSRGTFVPGEFNDLVDVADCALDEQLEQLQRQYAAASRAESRTRFALEVLEQADAVPGHRIAQASRDCAAAQLRVERLLAAIDVLEYRLEEE